MPNTVTQRTLVGGGKERNIYRSIHIASDGSEEADLVVYDNSAFMADVNEGKLAQVWLSGDACVTKLEWDQSTDEPAFSGNPSNGGHWDFRGFGGISNPGATGATGDLVLTTTGLDNGDEVFMVIHIIQG